MRNAALRFSFSSVLLLFALDVACNSSSGVVGASSNGGTSSQSTQGSGAGAGGTQSGDGGSGFTITIPTAAGGGGVEGSAGAGGSPVQSTAGNCGTVTGKAERIPADVLLVQDASGSMTWSIAQDCDCQGSWNSGVQACRTTTSCVDRWSTLKTAVSAAVTGNSAINWGLELFADPESQDSQGCTVASAPQVPISATSSSAIQQALGSVTPSSSTPTASAIKVATSYLKTVSDNNKKAILLATDGQPNCGGGRGSTDDLANTLTAIKAAADAGFPVYVVGIGPSTNNMDSMAQNGGTSKYYPATSPQELTDALAQISKVVASCSYTSATPPPDPSLVYVYVDKQLVQKDASNGWTFGADNSTIVLNGSTCDAIMSATSKQVEIVFGCPGVTPPDVIP